MDNNSLAHSRYNCTYHIVFIPKYRRKVMFGELRKDVGEILGKVCRMEGVTIIKAATLPDHVHMYVSIPPKLSVSKAVAPSSQLTRMDSISSSTYTGSPQA